MITPSEIIAIEQVLGIIVVPSMSFEHFMEGYNAATRSKVVALRNKIDKVVDVERTRANDLHIENLDLKYQIKELIIRIEERRDVRNDVHYKDLKNSLGVL